MSVSAAETWVRRSSDQGWLSKLLDCTRQIFQHLLGLLSALFKRIGLLFQAIGQTRLIVAHLLRSLAQCCGDRATGLLA